MTIPRSKLVDPGVSRWYHCITRCVRQASLLDDSRKQWIEDRLAEVSGIFAISVGGFAILDNHLHFLIRLDPDVAAAWSPKDVIARWAKLHPPRKKRKAIPITDEWLENQAKDPEHVEMLRQRLVTLGWFMKEVKEPLARLANQEDNCTGAFFEGRYKSIILLDVESILSVCAYIDLNPLACGIAETPESSRFTSLRLRIAKVQAQGRQADLSMALGGSVAACGVTDGLEESLWLIPIEDRRRNGSAIEGFLEGFTLGNYLILVDFTARLYREGKASLPSKLDDIFTRLGTSADAWSGRQVNITKKPLVGRFLANSRDGLRQASSQLGLHHCMNLNGCLAV